MTDTGSDSMHPGLTITVYRVNPETMERTPIRSRALPPADQPVSSLAYPPCACSRCVKGG
ncbi:MULTISPECIES: hypothetical protein [Streptomyces]|uniref:hypothetical protein n=1 Tax=Streptomyces TaxID=1883 RepID=UPI00117D173B|nr:MULTISPECIES: hypothetical protein [Streptomyces]